MKLKDWIILNQRTRPVFKDLTDEFYDLCQREPDCTMVRLARLSGLPEGVDPSDRRLQDFFGVERQDEQ